MNYRSTLMTAGAAVALAGFASAQDNTNGDYDHNWAPLAAGPAAIIVDPAFFGGTTALGDSIRLCYSVDVTQGGRNQDGTSNISWFDVAQAFGGNNTVLGVQIGQVMMGARVSDSLNDDACLSNIFITEGTPESQSSNPGGGDLLLGAPGLIAGTGGYSLNQGFFWDIAFEFIGTNLPGLSSTAHVDPVTPFANTPLLTHLVYEIQGPVDGSDTNRHYWLGSTSELNGTGTVTGGVTNGNSNFGSFQYLATADATGAAQGNRVTIADNTPALTGAGPVALLGGTNGELEWVSYVAFQTPYLYGANNGNVGGGGADWVLSGGSLSTINVLIKDKLAGGQSATSGSAASDPLLLFNAGFILWSGTPAVTTLQNALSWDDVLGGAPPKAGTYLIPPQNVSRVPGAQTFHANFDGTTSAFLSLGFSLQSEFTGAADPNLDAAGVTDLFTHEGPAGTSEFQTGAVALGTPAPSTAGTRLGIHAIGIQVNAATGGALEFTEMSNARTAVLQ